MFFKTSQLAHGPHCFFLCRSRPRTSSLLWPIFSCMYTLSYTGQTTVGSSKVKKVFFRNISFWTANRNFSIFHHFKFHDRIQQTYLRPETTVWEIVSIRWLGELSGSLYDRNTCMTSRKPPSFKTLSHAILKLVHYVHVSHVLSSRRPSVTGLH